MANMRAQDGGHGVRHQQRIASIADQQRSWRVWQRLILCF
jgi:hypothetical protein